MKIALRIALMTLPLYSSGQETIIGFFRGSFGHHLKINKDSSFHFRWLFDTQESWSQGVWTKVGDTIYLTVIPKYDTLKKFTQSGIAVDTLVLATYSRPMTAIEVALSNNATQNREMPPAALFYRKGRLYLVENSQIDRSKRKGFWTDKRFPTWYIRSKE
jgi:hypothetical protein